MVRQLVGGASGWKSLAWVGLAIAAGAGCKANNAEKAGTTALGAGSGPSETPPAKVNPITVTEQQMPAFVTFSGSLIANRESVVAAGGSGKVLETFVERGDLVQKGQILAKLDTRTADAMVAEASAQIESAKTQQALAKVECDRNEQLFTKGAISKADYDRAMAGCTTAKLSTQAAEARKTNIVASQSDSAIRAPFAGYVSERFINQGEFARPDSRVINLVQIDPVRAQLTVPEALVDSIKLGQKVELRAGAEGATRTVEGTVRFISPSIRESSRDLLIEAVVDNHDRRLKPGMFVVGRVNTGEHGIPVVPRTALRNDGTNIFLFAIADGRLEQRLVQLGETKGEAVAITDGLKTGEHIAEVASEDLRDGQKVQ